MRLGPQFENIGRHNPHIQWDTERQVPDDADIHPKMAETILNMAQRKAAQDHWASPEELKIERIERNPGFKPGYPSYGEVARSRGYDYPHEVPPHTEMRDYDFGAQASHSVEFSYPDYSIRHYPMGEEMTQEQWDAHVQASRYRTGGRARALYGINMFEEHPPSLWAD